MDKAEHNRTLPPVKSTYHPPSLTGLDVNRSYLTDEGVASEYIKYPPDLLQQIDLLVIGGQASTYEGVQEFIQSMTGEEIPIRIIRFHVTKYYDEICTARVDFLSKQRSSMIEELTEVAQSPTLARYNRMTSKTIGLVMRHLEARISSDGNCPLGEVSQYTDLIARLQSIDPMYKARTNINASVRRRKENRNLLSDKAKADMALSKLRNYQAEREKLEEETDEYEEMTQRIINGESV